MAPKFITKIRNYFSSVRDVQDIDVEIEFGTYLGMSIEIEEDRSPCFAWAMTFYRFFVFFYLLTLYTFLELVDMYQHSDSIVNMTETLAINAFHVATVLKVANLTVRKDSFHEIIDLIRKLIQEYVVDDEQRKELKEMTVRMLIIFFTFMIIVLVPCLLCVSTVFLDPDAIGTMFPYHIFVPHMLPHYFELMSIVTGIMWIGLQFVVHDSIYITLLSHLCCQIKVFQISLRRLRTENYTKPPIREIIRCLKHHQSIMVLQQHIEEVFSGILLVVFISSFIIIGSTGFQTIANESLGGFQEFIIYNYAFNIVFELYVFCWFSNQIVAQSEEIIFSGFSSSWYRYGRKYNQLLIILMSMAQQPIKMTAAGFFEISLDTYKVILTKAYSIVTLLRQVYSK